MSITPPNDNDFVNGVWIDTLAIYINHPLTEPPIKELLELFQKLVRDPDNHRQILDQEYLKLRDRNDEKENK